MIQPGIRRIQEVIWRTHRCSSTYVETVPVLDTVSSATMCAGDVNVFDLAGHPEARRCYGWIRETSEGTKKVVVVLHGGPIDGPLRAVQASFIAELLNRRRD